MLVLELVVQDAESVEVVSEDDDILQRNPNFPSRFGKDSSATLNLFRLSLLDPRTVWTPGGDGLFNELIPGNSNFAPQLIIPEPR